MIEGVIIKQLKQIPDERGKVMHMLRADDKEFERFGEVYFSKSYPGVVKGWHKHKKMTLNYCVIEGMVKLVLYDDRKDSKTYQQLQEIFIGEDNYCLVQIPPGIVNGYKTIGVKPSILINCSTHPHDLKEMIRINPLSQEIPYSWDIVMK
ncbi:dTDP-4-dehydrorhamnose 3,5-epimerase [Candidatus Roizmanbacteria bacterium RIFCSPHIGHO2_12_FULL_33_9]|uniref:dTDP-4-dehydrorhamnose 3,5-epimerase n=1 Tax=Candidatus Roizmanbacteria bacterium RIFCSPHIGHO2_12_FULL_33_9 TaxID=1802045 RepID=A0A1F7HEU9_9BACT|nr:MAG: dTDP-4-dehydrorhamnose 3,5-epimerase [Candidatus Roizmanbacteria bacterium RIFCSPHIGHO2_12_FULL_33_9]